MKSTWVWVSKAHMKQNSISTPWFFVMIGLAVLGGCSKDDEDPLPILTAEQTERIITASYRDFDYNRDKQVTCADVRRLRSDQFDALDKDNSGDLSRGEYRFAKFDDEDFNFQDYVRLDTDENGTLTKNEIMAVVSNRFASLDRDKNCFVSEEEMIMAGRIALDGRRVRGERSGPRRAARPKAPAKRAPEKIEEIPDEEDGGF